MSSGVSSDEECDLESDEESDSDEETDEESDTPRLSVGPLQLLGLDTASFRGDGIRRGPFPCHPLPLFYAETSAAASSLHPVLLQALDHPARSSPQSIESHQSIQLADKTSAQLNELYLAKLAEGELSPTASLFNIFCADKRRLSELSEVQTTGTFSLEVIDIECGMEQSAVAITVEVTPDGSTEPFWYQYMYFRNGMINEQFGGTCAARGCGTTFEDVAFHLTAEEPKPAWLKHKRKQRLELELLKLVLLADGELVPSMHAVLSLRYPFTNLLKHFGEDDNLIKYLFHLWNICRWVFVNEPSLIEHCRTKGRECPFGGIALQLGESLECQGRFTDAANIYLEAAFMTPAPSRTGIFESESAGSLVHNAALGLKRAAKWADSERLSFYTLTLRDHDERRQTLENLMQLYTDWIDPSSVVLQNAAILRCLVAVAYIKNAAQRSQFVAGRLLKRDDGSILLNQCLKSKYRKQPNAIQLLNSFADADSISEAYAVLAMAKSPKCNVRIAPECENEPAMHHANAKLFAKADYDVVRLTHRCTKCGSTEVTLDGIVERRKLEFDGKTLRPGANATSKSSPCGRCPCGAPYCSTQCQRKVCFSGILRCLMIVPHHCMSVFVCLSRRCSGYLGPFILSWKCLSVPLTICCPGLGSSQKGLHCTSLSKGLKKLKQYKA